MGRGELRNWRNTGQIAQGTADCQPRACHVQDRGGEATSSPTAGSESRPPQPQHTPGARRLRGSPPGHRHVRRQPDGRICVVPAVIRALFTKRSCRERRCGEERWRERQGRRFHPPLWQPGRLGGLPVGCRRRLRRSPRPWLSGRRLWQGDWHRRCSQRSRLLARNKRREGHRLRRREGLPGTSAQDNGRWNRRQREAAPWLLVAGRGGQRVHPRPRHLLRGSLGGTRAVRANSGHPQPKRVLAPQRHWSRVRLRRRQELPKAGGRLWRPLRRLWYRLQRPRLLGGLGLRGHLELRRCP